MAGIADWKKAIFPYLYFSVYREFAVLRSSADAGGPRGFKGDSRSRRRWSAADGTSDPGRYVPARKARACVFALRSNGSGGSCDWANSRGVDYGQLFLAMDLSDESAGRDRGDL